MATASSDSSLSVVDGAGARVVAASPPADHGRATNENHQSSTLDFIGSSDAVKDLFSLPYDVHRPISVAVHNIGGTLLLDTELDGTSGRRKEAEVPIKSTRTSEPHAGVGNQAVHSSTYDERPTNSLPENELQENQDQVLTRSLVALSSMESKSEALAIVNSIIDDTKRHKSAVPSVRNANDVTTTGEVPSPASIGIPSPDDYVSQFIPPTPEPREYINWKFRDMNLLVGSNALIYRFPDASKALTLRLEDVENMKALSQRHGEMVQSGEFVADHQYAELQQMGRPSYAETARRNVRGVEEREEENRKGNNAKKLAAGGKSPSFAAPDLDQVRLQTCIVPASDTPVGALVTGVRNEVGLVPLEPGSPELNSSRASSPVSAVLDTYLDNIMANVPQLALCLQEKGFVQSVKLLSTDQIPSTLLDPSTIDTSVPFEIAKGGKPSERVFSPEIMEMNAATLLRFLKTQCSKDNGTYLLRREAGQTNVQLYDISSQSIQSQQKWKWWLSTMSYRFATRLRSLEASTTDKALRREFRSRQRSLLFNTLELLESLSDINGAQHESLVAAINENLADSYLTNEEEEVRRLEAKTNVSPATFVSSRQPYPSASVDALGKAQDHLVESIRVLWPSLEKQMKRVNRRKKTNRASSRGRVVSVLSGDEESDSEEQVDKSREDAASSLTVEPIAIQLYGVHHKLVNVSLRLAEIHLGNYYSSSAMQALRLAAQRLADSVGLIQLIIVNERENEWMHQLKLQYTWLWEHCGHFARSFAADSLWRDRGHSSGEDVISVLVDVDNAFRFPREPFIGRPAVSCFASPVDSLTKKSKGSVTLSALSGVVSINSNDSDTLLDETSTEAAEHILSEQTILKREHRRVLVASCLAYGRAIDCFEEVIRCSLKEDCTKSDLLDVLHQRLGDACNESGNAIMNQVRELLPILAAERPHDQKTVASSAADALLHSAEFWFLEGLRRFELCKDLRNLALLRCNLCQCCKLRANSVLSMGAKPSKTTEGSTHAEFWLQEAAQHLQAAHESLEQRETDPMTWDMVSNELAATLLVLGVRRRQSLIGSGSLPVIIQALRLSPGKERSITEPMERALTIYEQLGNNHQAAAAHYQLALFFSKIWTCQRDEHKTREKLSSAFQHYIAAHAFFLQNVRGNEPTFCVLCLDLSNLYASVSGEEFQKKALLCCVDTSTAFSLEAVEKVASDFSGEAAAWMEKMGTLATEVEDRVFKQLRNLVKIEDSSEQKNYKELYRVGLQAKMSVIEFSYTGNEERGKIVQNLLKVNSILEAIRNQHDSFDKD